MSSTDLDAPPLRLILIAIFIVVGLHALTAIALVTIKAPEPKDEPIKETPPLEIQMVTLPAKLAESEVAEVEATPQSKAESIPESKTEPKPEPKFERKSEPKMKALTPADPVVTEKEPTVQKETPPEKLIIKEQPVKRKIENKQPQQKQIDADKAVADEQRRMIAAQAEKAAQQAESQAQAKALQEAHAAREAQAQADAKEAAQKAARAKAEREAESAARAEADAKAAAASNEPVNFTVSAANWASAPNFSFPDRTARRARSGDTLNVVLVLRVNKQGGIDSVRIAQSSGNTLLDKEAQRQVRSGKFKPFTKNGVPVVGNVTLPIAYAVP